MKITFYSNFLNHHQLPFCLAMHEKLGEKFKFVATEKIHKERLELGYEDMSQKYPFSINAYENKCNYEQSLILGNESDVVIIGSAPDDFIKDRLKSDKLTFRYSERVLKKGRYRIFDPRVYLSLIKNHTRFRNKNLYMLCASAYTAADFSLVGAYPNKNFKWGYFPDVKKHDLDSLMKRKKNKVTKILWVGRLIDWKHPEDAIRVALMLKNKGYLFQMDMIGYGVNELYLKQMIKKFNLSNYVNLLGSMTPERVRDHMESANIFLFTSDFNEGWGAVLNESMNSGCAVVASHAIGSVPFLLKNKKNGLIYKNGDLEHLCQHVIQLLENQSYREQLGIQAYKTLSESWNAENAADRLVKLSQSILYKDEFEFVFEEGPCSRAEVLSQKFMC